MASYVLQSARSGYSTPAVGGTQVVYAAQPSSSGFGAFPAQTSNVVYSTPQYSGLDGHSGALVLAPEPVTVQQYQVAAPAAYTSGAVVPYTAPSMQSWVTRKQEVVHQGGRPEPGIASNQLVTIPTQEDAALRSVSRFHHPVPHLVGAAPNIYGNGVDPRKKLLQTDMGDIILLGDSENVLRHVTMALAPVLEQVNTLRYRQGLHPIGIERKFVGRTRQQLVFDKFHHIAIFCCSGGNIRSLNSTLDKTDWKWSYTQCHTGKCEILMFIVGDITLPIAGGLLNPNPNHNELYDPILRDSGVFQNCTTTQRKLKCGEVFSFQTNLNPIQQKQLHKIIVHVQRRCKTLDKQSNFFS